MNPEIIWIIAVLYLILNGISFFLFGSDKRRAVKDLYRISESALLSSGFLGPFGALAGMKVFRHKTRKTKFKAIYLFVVIHLMLIAFLAWKFLL